MSSSERVLVKEESTKPTLSEGSGLFVLRETQTLVESLEETVGDIDTYHSDLIILNYPLAGGQEGE